MALVLDIGISVICGGFLGEVVGKVLNVNPGITATIAIFIAFALIRWPSADASHRKVK